MTIFTVLLPLCLIVKVSIWAEWRLREVIFNAAFLDACSMLTGYCAAVIYLMSLAVAGGQLAAAGPDVLREIVALAAVLTLLATPMSVLLIAIRAWPKGGRHGG